MIPMNKNFHEFMNPPEPPYTGAYVQADKKTNVPWVCCPHCGSKNFPIREDTVIRNLPWKCKSTKCKKEFEVNI